MNPDSRLRNVTNKPRRIIVAISLLIVITAIILMITGLSMRSCISDLLNPGYPMYDSAAYAHTWIDENLNGIWEESEDPLEGVCIQVLLAKKPPEIQRFHELCGLEIEGRLTDANGEWPPSRDDIGAINFYAGAACDDLWIYAQAPNGYRSTTSQLINGCEGNYGFHRSN